MARTCTSLDHIYPEPVSASTKCYCGRRTWGGPAARLAKLPSIGTPVRARGELRMVAAHLKDGSETLAVLDSPVGGSKYWSAGDLEVAS